MRSRKLTGAAAMLFAVACNHQSALNHANAAANVALAATVLAAQTASSSAASSRSSDRPSSVGANLYSVGAPRACSSKASYLLYCDVDHTHCVYRTNFGTEFICQQRDCSDGVPAALERWCNPEN